MTDVPIKSIRKIVKYMWCSESHHFEAHDEDDPAREKHIFLHMLKVRKWIEEVDTF